MRLIDADTLQGCIEKIIEDSDCSILGEHLRKGMKKLTDIINKHSFNIDKIIQAKIDKLEEFASSENSEGRWMKEEKYIFAKEYLEEILEEIKKG